MKPAASSQSLPPVARRWFIKQLRGHRRKQAADRLSAGSAWENLDLVFCTPTGAPIDSRDDWVEWRDLPAEAHVRPARVHDARHSQLSQTERYTHVTRALSKDAASRMTGVL